MKETIINDVKISVNENLSQHVGEKMTRKSSSRNTRVLAPQFVSTILASLVETKPFWSWHIWDFGARKISFFEIGKILCVSKAFWWIKMIKQKFSRILKKTRGPYHVWASQKLQKTSVTTAQLIRKYIRLYKGIWTGFGTIPPTIFTWKKKWKRRKNRKFKKAIFL